VPFIGAALVLVTLPHHWRVKNFATLSIIAWLVAFELTYGVNAVIWADNVGIRAQVWCDIATKIQIGAQMGLPGCCLCMARRLNRIAYGQEMSPRGWSHRALDIWLCWGFPVLIMVLHYIVQGHRFDIIENLGCFPAIYISWPSLIILGLSAFVPSVLALLFCILALTRLLKRQINLNAVLFRPNPTLTASRYVRLMVMTFALGSWSAILVSVGAANEYASGLSPYTSWADVHLGFGFIGQATTAALYKDDPGNLRSIYIEWSAVSVSSLAFFLFFGIGVDAAREYRACGCWMWRVVFRQSCPTPEPSMTESVVWAPSEPGDIEKSGTSGTYFLNLHKQLPDVPPYAMNE